MSFSLYRTNELGSGVRLSHSKTQDAADADYSFIAVLALAQRLEIPIIPVTWQALLGDLGQGGQASISQASANVQTQFAFKRFRGNIDDSDENTSFQALVNEMTILRHHAVYDHPHIVTLEGICWDISEDGSQIWPALLFEKSTFGDLFDFVRKGHGGSLSIPEKLKLCADVGIAIRDIHMSNIIHGDIKPQNVLVFKDKDRGFSAMMADFGFSTGFLGENDKIYLPKSLPWNAPEYHTRHFSPDETKRMDLYSFGLLCFWFLFEDAGQLPRASWMQHEEFLISFGENQESLNFLERLKKNENDDFLEWVCWIINQRGDLTSKENHDLQRFFRFTLALEPDRRNVNYNELLSLLAPNTARQPLIGQIDSCLLLAEECFELQYSPVELYQSDFRLRTCIADSLHSIASECPTLLTQHISPRKAAFQLALCYRVGFGVHRDEMKSRIFLEKSLQDICHLDQELLGFKNATERTIHTDSKFQQVANSGCAPWISLPLYYRERNILERAHRVYIQEIADIQSELQDAPYILMVLKAELAKIYDIQQHWDKAEDLFIEVVELRTRVLGLEHLHTLSSMANLTSVYKNQGRWEMAQEMDNALVDIYSMLLGQEHPLTLSCLGNLASTYRAQEQWAKAEELDIQVVETRTRLAGPDHPDTLNSIGNLASTYSGQEKWVKAEKLEIPLVEASTRVFGPEHLHTFTSIGNLAATYGNQGQWAKAEELLFPLTEARTRLLGRNHPETLNSIWDLAVTYDAQKKWSEAEELKVQVLEARTRLSGPEHPDTLASMEGLALTYNHQERYAKTEVLRTQVVEISIRVLGLENPKTLSRMSRLADTCCQQGDFAREKELEAQLFELISKAYGPKHSKTLASMEVLALTYTSLRDWGNAEQLQVQLVEISTEVLGLQHKDTLLRMNDLVRIYEFQGNWDKAAELEAQVLEIEQRMLSSEDPENLLGLANLALI